MAAITETVELLKKIEGSLKIYENLEWNEGFIGRNLFWQHLISDEKCIIKFSSAKVTIKPYVYYNTY